MANGFKVEKIELNSPGIRAPLQSSDMMAGVKKEAVKKGEPVKEYVGFDRVHVVVKES